MLITKKHLKSYLICLYKPYNKRKRIKQNYSTMKKSILIFLLGTYSLLSFAQNKPTAFTKTTDFKTGICTITQKTSLVTPELSYTLIKTIDVKNENKTTYIAKFTMLKPFQKTLNNQLFVSAELGDGTFIDNKPTKESAGWFKGTFTIEIKPERRSVLGVKHIMLRGEKVILYHITESNNETFKNNLKQIMQEQI
jgi:hypothetical protein